MRFVETARRPRDTCESSKCTEDYRRATELRSKVATLDLELTNDRRRGSHAAVQLVEDVVVDQRDLDVLVAPEFASTLPAICPTAKSSKGRSSLKRAVTAAIPARAGG